MPRLPPQVDDSPRASLHRTTCLARSRRSHAYLALGLAAAVALTACDGKAVGEGSVEKQSVAKGLTVSGEWPLTGLPARGVAPTHPVMVVKIDNTGSSAPQVGLGRADLVTEELVEGGLTRLAAFYYQRLPASVGPVRSMRATDIGILRPAKAILVASGGAPPTVRRMHRAGVKTYTEGSQAPGFQRDESRRAPYNLFMHLKKLAPSVEARDNVPGYLPFGPAAKKLPGQQSSGLDAVFSGGHTTAWAYRDGRYVNENSFAARGDRFRPDNVLVLRVEVGDAGYRDPAGNPVPETKFTGSGEALLFHGGRVVRGTWSKTLTSTIKLRTKAGPLAVPAGHTWVELVPENGGKVVVRR